MTPRARSSFVDSLIDLYDSGSSEGDSNLRLDEFEEAMEDLGRGGRYEQAREELAQYSGE